MSERGASRTRGAGVALGVLMAFMGLGSARPVAADCPHVWQQFGGEDIDNAISTLLVNQNELIAAGAFTEIGGVPCNRIARWDGAQWQPFGVGMNGSVEMLYTYADGLLAGGYFTQAGGQPANGIAWWDGTQWNAIGNGFSGVVFAATTYLV